MIAPSIAAGAAMRSAANRLGRLARSRTLPQLGPAAAAVGADEVEAGRVGAAQPDQRADQRGEEDRQRGEDDLRRVAVEEDGQDRADGDDRQAVAATASCSRARSTSGICTNSDGQHDRDHVAAEPAQRRLAQRGQRCWASRTPSRRDRSGAGSRSAAAPPLLGPNTVRPITSQPRPARPSSPDHARQPGSPHARALGTAEPLEEQLAELVPQLVEVRRVRIISGVRGRGRSMSTVAMIRPGPRAHHRDRVGEEHRLGDRVGDEQRGGGPLGPDALQLEVEPLAGHLVERAERLVEQQDLRLDHQRPGDRDPLAHAAGQLGRPGLLEALEADQLDQVGDRRRRRPSRR